MTAALSVRTLASAWPRVARYGVLGVLAAYMAATVPRPASAGPEQDRIVLASAAAQSTPPQITLLWPLYTNYPATSYFVFRKLPAETNWAVIASNVAPAATSYTDTTVSAGVQYEYRVERYGSYYTGKGYLLSGIELPATGSRGKLVLIVDNTVTNALAAELARLMQDFAGDGWTVIRHDVPRDGTPPQIKALIQADYAADPAQVKAVFFFGHVPVARSGWVAPDGHGYNMSPWPCDPYYGDMDGEWTDASMATTNNEAPWYTNVPGDNLFDQSNLPSDMDLQVGRVDLWALPEVLQTETELLRQYLNKDHNYRHALVRPRYQAFVHNQFGLSYGGQNAWATFAPLVGAANLFDANYWWQPVLPDPYIVAYGDGPGSPNGAGDCLYTPNVSNHDAAVFMIVFGSNLGKWDYTNCILRAELATPVNGLTCVWGDWGGNCSVYRMALGETVGECFRQIMTAGRGEYNGLMGDPTLRMHMFAPPADLTAFSHADGMDLDWAPSPDTVLGYYVYHGASTLGPFTRVSGVVAGTAFHDSDPPNGPCVYMVRAMGLTTGSSASYYNLSQGIFAAANGNGTPPTTAPGGVAASDGAYIDRVRITWSASLAATASYEVWRAPLNDTNAAVRLGATGDTVFDDLFAMEGTTNFYWVRVCNGAGTGPFGSADSGFLSTAPPTSPAWVSATDGRFTDIVAVAWTPIPRAVCTYDVWRAPVNDPASATRLAGNLTATNYDDATVPAPGVAQYYWVRVNKVNGTSGFGNADSGFRKLSPPAWVTATDGSLTNTVRVSWAASEGAAIYEIWRGYNGYGPSFTPFKEAEVTNTTYDFSALPNAIWFFAIRARNNVSRSEESEVNSGYSGLLPPGGVTASDGALPDRVRITWAGGVTGATGYRIWRSATSDPAAAGSLGVTDGLWAAQFDDLSASVPATYWYWVTATNASGASAFSAGDSGCRAVEPYAPAGVMASDGTFPDKIQVNWNASASATSYDVWRNDTTNSGTASFLASAAAAPYDDASAATGVTYTYWIKAVSGAVTSVFSAGDSGYISIALPDAPANLSASDGTSTSAIQLAWSAASRASSYEIWRATTTNSGAAQKVGETAGLAYDDPVTFFSRTYYWVKAGNPIGVSGFSNMDDGYRNIPPPSTVAASDGTYTDKVLVAWAFATGASTYEIWRNATDDLGTATLLAESGVYQTQYTDSNATMGTPYFYWVRGKNTNGPGFFGSSERGHRALAAPPAGVTASDGAFTNRVRVTWNASLNATEYEVWRNTTNRTATAVRIGAPAATNHDDLDAAPGTNYYYWVKTLGGAVTSDFSGVDSGYAAVAAPPTGVAASDGAYTDRVQIAWGASANATGYEVWRSGSNQSSTAAMIASPADTNCADTNAVPGAIYFYWVKARSASVTSDFSNADSGYRALAGSPAPPTGVAATDGAYTNLIRVTWTASTDLGGYEIWRSTTNDPATAAKLGATSATAFDDTAVSGDALYCYWIKTTNAAGAGAFSVNDSGYVALVPPAVIGAGDGIYTNKIRVSWTASSLASAYEVWRGLTPDSLVKITETTSRLYDDTSVADGTTWYYSVKAKNKVSTSGFSPSDPGFRAASSPPLPPLDLAASDGDSDYRIHVAWEELAKATGYQVWRGTNADPALAVLLVDRSFTFYDDFGVTNAVRYYYWIKAKNSAGVGAFSAPDPGYLYVAPATGIAASDGVYTNFVRVAWAASANAAGYEIWRHAAPDPGSAVRIGTATNTSYDDGTAVELATNWYWVVATNAGGPSAFSAGDSGYRLAAGPGGLQAEVISATRVRLTWIDNSSIETGFKIECKAGASAYAQIAVVASNVTSYLHTGLTAGVTYTYRVRASAPGGDTLFSSEAGATLNAPAPNTTNAVPYAESFEDYPTYAVLIGTNGWYGSREDDLAITDDPTILDSLLDTYQRSFPLATNHTRVARIQNTVTNLIAGPRGANTWVDLLIQPDPRSGAPALQVEGQCGVQINSNGLPVVRSRDLNLGSNVWVAIDRPPLATGAWVRLSLALDYATPDAAHPGQRYVQVYLQEKPLTNAAAYTSNDGAGQPGGSWFALMQTNADHLSSVAMSGSAYLDDLVVTTNTPSFSDRNANGLPDTWELQYFGGVTNADPAADADRDGLNNWQEWLAGTHPQDSNSVFRLTAPKGVSAGGLVIRWPSLAERYYTLSRSTNLLLPGAGFAIVPGAGNLPATPTENVYTDTVTGAAPAYYRITVHDPP